MSSLDLFDAEVLCDCGRRYGIFDFVHLPLPGVQDLPATATEPKAWAELRVCVCRSDRAREVCEERAAWLKHRAVRARLELALETKVGLREAFTAERHAWDDWMRIARASFTAAQVADGRRAA